MNFLKENRMKPVRNKVLIQTHKKTMSDGGIILPTKTDRKVLEGHVVSYGPDVEIKELKVGQKVLYAEYAGMPYRNYDIDYIIIEDNDIMLILE